MFNLMRSKFGPAIVTLIIGFIAFVFIFFGVYSPQSGGMSTGGSAAVVGGEAITFAEFSRSYQQRMQFYEGLMKGKADPAMLARLGLRKAVLDDLVRQKAMTLEARRQGFTVADEEIALRIKEMPYFKKDGKFDKATYEQLLQANGQTPGRFESTLRDDITLQRMNNFLRSRIMVSEAELQREFQDNADQRQVEYVLVSPPPQAKPEEARLAAKTLADEVLVKARTGGAALKAFLKNKKMEARTTEKFSSTVQFVPGVGNVPELKADAFREGSTLAKEPKVYETNGFYVVAWGLKATKADVSEYAKTKDKLLTQVQSRKERGFYEDWSKGVMARTRVSLNEELIKEPTGDEDDAPRGAPMNAGPEEI
jgi:peptidyl-prolyl cis-trans isomerase D